MQDPKDLRAGVGTRLLCYLQTLGLKPSDVAQLLDFSPSQLTKLQKGLNYSADLIIKIKERYSDLELDWLLHHEGPMSTKIDPQYGMPSPQQLREWASRLGESEAQSEDDKARQLPQWHRLLSACLTMDHVATASLADAFAVLIEETLPPAAPAAPVSETTPEAAIEAAPVPVPGLPPATLAAVPESETQRPQPAPTPTSVGGRLKAFMEWQGLTPEKLAVVLECSTELVKRLCQNIAVLRGMHLHALHATYPLLSSTWLLMGTGPMLYKPRPYQHMAQAAMGRTGPRAMELDALNWMRYATALEAAIAQQTVPPLAFKYEGVRKEVLAKVEHTLQLMNNSRQLWQKIEAQT